MATPPQGATAFQPPVGASLFAPPTGATPDEDEEAVAAPAASSRQPRLIEHPVDADFDIETPNAHEFLAPRKTAEDLAVDRVHQGIIDDTKTKTGEFNSQFNFMQRQSNRLAVGNLRGTAKSLLHDMSSMRDMLSRLEANNPETRERIASMLSPTGVPPQEESEIDALIFPYMDGLAQQLEAKEKEYFITAEASANPQVNDAEGTLVDLPDHPVMAAIGQAQLAGDDKLVNRLISNFLPETLAEVALPSLAQGGFKQVLIPGLVAGVAKIATGSTLAASIGFGVSTGAVSGGVEFDQSFGDFFEEHGVDLTDERQVSAALDNPELVKSAKSWARKRGLSVALWDFIGARLATKMLVPPGIKSKLAKQLTNLGVQVVQQGATGAAGEAQAGLVTEFEVNPTDVKLEAFGELAFAPAEVVTFAVANRLGLKAEKLMTNEAVLTAYAKNPSITMEQALEMLKETAASGITHEEAVAMIEAFPKDGIEAAAILKNGNQASTQISGYMKIVAENSAFEDTEGNTLFGSEIVDRPAGQPGQVYWSNGEVIAEGDVNVISRTANTLSTLDEKIASQERDLNNLKSQQGSFQAINELTDEIESLKETRGKIARDVARVNTAKPGMRAFVQNMAQLFMPNTDIMIIEDSHLAEEIQPAYGSAGAYINPETGKRTQVIYLNTGKILDIAEEGTRRIKPIEVQGSMMEVLGHEFGHALMQTVVDTLPAPVFQALQSEHRMWLAQQLSNVDQPISALIGSKKGAFEGKVISRRRSKSAKQPVHKFPKSAVEYHLGFTEWVADAINRQLTNKDSKNVAPLLRKHLPRLAKIMQMYFDRSGLKAFNSNITIDTFLTYIKARTQLDTIQKIESSFSEAEKLAPADMQGAVIAQMLELPSLDIPSEVSSQIQADLDTFNKGMSWTATLLQVRKANPHIGGLNQYVKAVHEHWMTKSNWNDQAMQTMNKWRELGRKTGDEVGRFLLERTVKSDELQRALTNDEVAILLQEKNINFRGKNTEAWEVIKQIDSDFSHVLDELYLIEKNRINQENADVESQRKGKIADLDRTFSALRNRNYYPLSRFGKWGIAMKAKKATTIAGRAYAKGETVHMELFENKRQRKSTLGQLKRKYGSNIQETFFKVEEDQQPFSGLPASIMRHLKNNPKLGLTEEQKKQLQTMIDTMSPTQSIAKRMLERKGTDGFHRDAARGYANYMMQMGGHIAKMRHVGQMDEAVQSVRKSARYIGEQGIVNDKRFEIVEYLTRHQDYIMNPVNELGGLRAMAFHWFLGYNPKSAVVNLTQVPLVAYPYLASRKELTGGLPGASDAIAIAELVKAMKDARQIFRVGGSNISIDEQAIIEQLTAEGIIDESLATELAGQAHSDMISRNMPRETAFTDTVHRGWENLARGSTFMFQAAEKFNRRTVALATVRLAKKQGMTPEQQLDEAREALRTTQFEYARWNRAAFMRGKAGVFFVFMQYLQNVLSFTIQDPGRVRYLLMMLMMGGLQGLPGAEDLLDLYDFGDRWLRKHLRNPGTDPRADIREDIRNLVISLEGSPELLMHGLSAQSFGLGLTSVNDMMGTSIPSLSFEGSISAGRVIPGWEALVSPNRLSGAGAVEGAKDILGAAITIPMNILRWTRDEDPSEIRSLERMLPSFLKGPAKAFRAISEGDLTATSGKSLVDFDMSNPEHIGELIGMALGANPTRLARAQEARWAEREAIQYYTQMRGVLQLNYNFAKLEERDSGDDEAVKIVRKRIDWFNREVPDGQEMVNFGANYARFLIEREKDKVGVGRRVLDLPAQREVRESFPAATEERIR